MQWELPPHARVDAIQARYEPALIVLRQWAARYDEFNDSEVVAAAQAAAGPHLDLPEVVTASISHRGGFGFPVNYGSIPVGSWGWLIREARVGQPVVNHWSKGADDFVEYREAIMGRDGSETFISLTIDLGRIAQ